jgi:hypothetical protein
MYLGGINRDLVFIPSPTTKGSMSTSNGNSNSPSHDELEELMLSCRYGDLEDVQAFVERYGWDPVAEVRDESGNTVLHMICGNGHIG